jgi:endonuclease/exonuclease/phosphatase family metal-dependent hydrolase
MQQLVRILGLVGVLAACGGDDDGAVGPGDAGTADAGPRLDGGAERDGFVPPASDSGAEGDDSGGGGADAGSAPDGGGEDGFELLTINLQNSYLNGSTWPARRDAIAAAITTWQPDAVCIQEAVETGSDPNDAQEVADRTGYTAEILLTHMAFLFEEGIAALSRWPIVHTESAKLPIEDLAGVAERHVLMVDVATDAREVRVFCSHMSISTDSGDKADEAVAAFEFMDARRSARSAFFAGDLNAEPDTLAMQMLRGEAMHGGVTGDLADAWATLYPSDPGYTIPSDAPDRRIDYVYVVPGNAGPEATPRECERVFTMPISGSTYASDHLGVRCVFD